MTFQNKDVKRVGIKARDKLGDEIVFEAELNCEPEFEWTVYFKKPSKFSTGEAYVGHMHISGKKITFNSSEKELNEKLKWLDSYIEQANEKYARKKREELDKAKREQEKEEKKKEELDEINKRIADM